MEFQLKNSLLFLTAVSLTLNSCEKDTDSTPTGHSVNHRFNQSMDWIQSHSYQEIIVLSDDYHVLFMGDSHVGSTKNLDTLFNIAKTISASAVVMAGDLTDGDKKDYPVLEQCLPLKDSLLSFKTPGNHDLWSRDGWGEFYTRFGPSCYLFTIKTPVATDLYVCLDSGSGTLGADQLKWFENILQNQRPGYCRCIVFTHNNFFRFRHVETANPLVEELHVLIELFTRHHVDMLITGHDHKKDDVVFGITTYIVMDPLKDGAKNAGYLELRVKDGDIMYNFENFD